MSCEILPLQWLGQFMSNLKGLKGIKYNILNNKFYISFFIGWKQLILKSDNGNQELRSNLTWHQQWNTVYKSYEYVFLTYNMLLGIEKQKFGIINNRVWWQIYYLLLPPIAILGKIKYIKCKTK